MPYTNSPLVEYTRLSQAHSGQKTHGIDRITPHCVVGQLSAETLGEWFYPRSNGVSANYAIDCNGRIGLYVDEKNRSWCSSNAENDNRAVTIECASDKTHPYAFRDVVYQRLIALCADICRRNGKTKLLWIPDKAKALAYKPAEDEMLLTVHRWFLDTVCPGEWLMQRMGDLAERVTALLAAGEQEESEEYADDGPEAVTPPTDPMAYQETEPATATGAQAKALGKLSNVQIVDTVGPLFTEDQRKTGILASVSMAQFILESGYARTELAQNSNNCFGMKCCVSGNTWPGSVWDGESKFRILTDEYNADGSKFTLPEYFRAYPCIEDSIADHSAYLLGAMNGDVPRYAGLAGCTDYRKAAQIIKAGGYATAPDYVDALCQIIEIWGLTKWDLPQEQATPIIPDPSPDVVMIQRNKWNAIKAALVVAYQTIKECEEA